MNNPYRIIQRIHSSISRRKALLVGVLVAAISEAKAAADCACLPAPNCNSVCPNGGAPRGDGTQACDCYDQPAAPTVGLLDAYPVGSIYMSVNDTNPSTLFGGTWEALDEGRVLIGASSAHPAGEKGGEETHKLITSEMPSHTHSGSSSSAGGHSHTRGSMEITGWFSLGNNMTAAYIDGTVFQRKEQLWGRASDPAVDSNKIQMYASNGWSGSTSSGGSHSHSMSLNNTGGDAGHNNMQPYLSVYMWKRTA